MLARMMVRWLACAAVLAGCGDNTKVAADAIQADAFSDDPRSLPLETNPSASACGAPDAATVAHAAVGRGHCAWVFADGLGKPRGIYVDSTGTILVVDTSNGGRVVALWDDDGDRVSSPSERAELVPASTALGLTHGIWVHAGFLYASSQTTVYRWPYVAGTRAPLAGAPAIVVHDLPAGGHITRTLVAEDSDHWLYVSVGSGSNQDANSSRARVVRYDLDAIPAGGYAWDAGEVFADGLRNEVGLAFDGAHRLWGVQNGMDDIYRSDIPDDIHNNNPAETVNLFAQPGAFHGYPYCWSEYLLPPGIGRGRGTQWVTEAFRSDGTHDDAWCRAPANVTRPALGMRAHSAPLGIVFAAGADLAPILSGDALVALHGSWDRDPPTGYKVVRLIFDDPTHVARYDPFVAYEGPGDIDPGAWPHRPVDLAIAKDGTVLVTSDASGVVLGVAKTR
jgi:glucose/arabinose dehydrogenase